MRAPSGGKAQAGSTAQQIKSPGAAPVAIYSASVKTISRKAGRSATAAAAYRTGSLVIDERTGETHDYTRKEGVEHVSRHLPHGLSMDTNNIWNAAEAAEKRKDATVARELVAALAHELSPTQRTALAESIADALVERYGVAAESSIHAPDVEGDQRNHHVHIQFSTRRMNEDGSFGAKTRELDDIKQGKIEVEWIRELVEEKTNFALEAAGLDVRVDRRSLKDQRAAALEAGDLVKAQELDRAPQTHEGPKVTDIRREAASEGRESLGALDRAAANDGLAFDLDAGKAELAEVVSMIEFIEKRAAEHDSAHVEAIAEDDLRDRITVAKIAHEIMQYERSELGIELAKGKPHFVLEAEQLKREMRTTKRAAEDWRKEHPIATKVADTAHIKLNTDLISERAAEAYLKSPEKAQAQVWVKQHNIDDARYEELTGSLSTSKTEFKALQKELHALNSPDPEVTELVAKEVAAGIENARPQIADFVDKHGPEIAAAADLGGVEAWMSSEIIETGNPIIDQLSRKAAQFRQRMMREEMQRAEQNDAIAAQAVRKLQASLRKALDGAFRSAAREAEPKVDHATEARKRALEAAAAALRVPQQAAKPYVPTWKRGRHDETDLKYEP